MQTEASSQLNRHLKAVLSRRSTQALCLWGEPGVGKTHLIQTLLNETPCRSFGLQANAPIIALTRVLPQPEDLSQEVQRLWEALEQGENLPVAKLVKALAAVLSGLAPVVLHLENLHEAGEQLEWIHQLTALLPKLRGVGLIVTSRSAQSKPFQNYELTRLSRAESDELLNQHLKTTLPPEGLEWIFERALGNPLFSLEYLTYLSRQGFFWSDGTRWHWRVPPKEFIPPSLEALIYEWVNRYAIGPTRQILETRALLPEAVTEDLWSTVAEVKPAALAETRQSLQHFGMLRGEQIAHPLIATVLRREIGAEVRKSYALRALQALEEAGLEPSPELISDAHLGQSKTLQIYQRLAEEAKARQDLPRAGYWLALASEQAQGEDQIALALEAAGFLRHSDINRALNLAQMAAYAPPHNREAVYLCAELWMTQGNSEQAETLLGLLSAAERQSQRWWATLIRLHYSTHTGHAEVLRLWELQPQFHPQADPETVLYVSAVLGQRGQFEAAFALTKPLLEHPDLSPFLRSRVLENQAIFYYLMGQSESALSQIEQAIALGRTLNQPAHLAKLLRREGRFAENVNQFSRAIGNYREALKLLSEHGSELDLAQVQTSLAPLLVDQGQYEEAESLYLQGLSVLGQSDNKVLQCSTRIGLTLLYLDWKPAYSGAMALKHGRVALDLARETSNQQMLHSSLSTLAMAEAVFGNAERALELAQQSLDESFTGPSAVRKARSLYALGLALEGSGQIGEAITALSECEQAHLKLGFEATAQRFGLELDRLTQNIQKARERLEWFRSQGLMGGANIALRYFPELEPASEVPQTAQTLWPRLCLLGPPMLENEGQTVPYRGRKRLELLAYLLETRIAGKPEATLLELMDALYPDTDEAGAKAILKQLVYLLRNQLGSQAIVSTASGYALGAMESDVEHFIQTEDYALWRGGYLEGLGEGWFPEVREGLLERLQQAGREYLESDPALALRLGEIWQAMEPYDLKALHLSLRALQLLGDEKRLERTYKQGAARLKEVGEVLPATSGLFLAEKGVNL